MSLRILLTCENYYPYVGGAEVCAASLRKEFLRAGHTVMLFTNTMATTDDEMGIVRIPWSFTPPGIWRNVRALWKLMKSHDIVHSQYCFRLAAIAALLARIQGRPMVLTQQGKGIVPEAGTLFRHRPLVALCRWLSLRLATLVTSTSKEITDLTAQFVPRSKIVDVTNGYDAGLFRSDPSLPIPGEFVKIPSATKKILTVRRLNSKNAIHILVQALALVHRENVPFHYFAIGDGVMRPFIEELIREFHLEPHVTLLGARANNSLPAYYRHADLVVIPSTAEATSITCIEAMGMEKPVIASRVGGLIELLGRENTYGQLVDIYGSEECTYDAPRRLPEEKLRPLSDAILAFLKDPSPLRERAKQAAAHVREKFSWETIARQYEELYERLPMSR